MHDGLDPAHVRTIAVRGVPTRVYDAGAGEPIVFVHGGLFGSLYSLDCWSLNLGTLAESFRVVAFDKLGQGHTGNPDPPGELTFDRLLEHATGVLDELALGPVQLVGHSMGALLVAEIARTRPELVRTLVLVDSNTLAPDDPRFPRGAFYRELERRTPPGPPTRATVRMEPDAQSFSTQHVSDDFVGRLLEIASLASFAQMSATLREVRASIWEPSLEGAKARALDGIDTSGLPCPTLVVWGANDISAPLPLAHALFQRIAAHTPQAELHILARAGHYCFREQPEAFARVLQGFCSDR